MLRRPSTLDAALWECAVRTRPGNPPTSDRKAPAGTTTTATAPRRPEEGVREKEGQGDKKGAPVAPSQARTVPHSSSSVPAPVPPRPSDRCRAYAAPGFAAACAARSASASRSGSRVDRYRYGVGSSGSVTSTRSAVGM